MAKESVKKSKQRIALLIGNGNYPRGILRNPENDVDKIGMALTDLGFDVIIAKNLNNKDMDSVIDAFGEKLMNYDVALFYYSGHGSEAKGENYLFPIDAHPINENDVKYECFPVNKIVGKMEDAGTKTNILLLDACRNNPFQKSWHRDGGSGGLINMAVPSGVFYGFSTSPGSTADDGDGTNSPFVVAILKHLHDCNSSIDDIFTAVNDDVQKITFNKQVPFKGGTLNGKFYFCGSKANPDNSFEPEMVFVEGGTFKMGNDNGNDNEKPVHNVTLKSFYISKFELTQSQWKAVMGNNPSAHSGCDSCPVENVSWDDAQKFISKLNKLTGKEYRLPYEAEWEYAATGGKESLNYKYSGGAIIDEIAWYGANSGESTHPVGQKHANELGLYDMSGNVWEWCNDRYDAKYYDNSPAQDPHGPSTGDSRSLRGGSWDKYDTYCRVSARGSNLSDHKSTHGGIRLVLVKGF